MKECQHLWVRRRDGKICIDCGERKFGSSELTEEERERLQRERSERTGDGH